MTTEPAPPTPRWAFAVDPATGQLSDDCQAVLSYANQRGVETLTLSDGSDKPVEVDVLVVPEGADAAALRRTVTATRAVLVRSRVRLGGYTVDADVEFDKYGVPIASLTAAIAASRLDRLLAAAQHWPLREEFVWSTGLPRHDLILTTNPPVSLAEREAELRDELGEQRLILIAEAPELTPADRTRIAEHAAQRGATVQDLDSYDSRPTTAQLRVADVVITGPAGALDFMVTGRPLLMYAPAGVPLPVLSVIGDIDALLDALTGALEGNALGQQLARDLLFDFVDDGSTARLVERLLKPEDSDDGRG